MSDSGGLPDPNGPLADAVRVALEALEERVAALTWMLTDTRLYGLAEPERVRQNLTRDEGACALLRTSLSLPARAARAGAEVRPAF